MNKIKHIAFLNPQGNFDYKDSCWTAHPDFGGQLVYVKELSKALAKMDIKVDIITRQIHDPNWSKFNDLYDSYPGLDNLRIIRLPFGGDKFLAKEKLWPHLKEYIDSTAEFYDEEGFFPDFFTTHYGSGGLAGVLLKEKLEIPFSFTAHSLAAQKMDELNFNKDNFAPLIDRFKFHSRIIGERLSMQFADKIIVSTAQEKNEQYSHPYYQGSVDLNNQQKFSVIPPGVNTELFNGSYSQQTAELTADYLKRDLEQARFDKPALVAGGRLVEKKNHLGLVKAFAADKKLQEKANLVIILRGIKDPFSDYSSAAKKEREILDQIMAVIKKNNLKNKVAMFSLNSQKELAECYGYLAEKKSIFVLNSFYESFSLASIEAMAAGLPVVVTKNGGQKEIIGDNEYGILIDPKDPPAMTSALKKLIDSSDLWHNYQKKAKKRVSEKYSWSQTAASYLQTIDKTLRSQYKNSVIHSEIPAYYFLPDSHNEHKLIERFKKNIFKK